MSVKKFKFVSPGVFTNEIDNSRLPSEPEGVGPVVIGRLPHGPAMRPVQVTSFEEFIDIFGAPEPGGKGGDVWRDGNKSSPTYAGYAAQAWLRNSSPITVMRLVGMEHSNAATAGLAGWKTTYAPSNSTGSAATAVFNGGAYGLWVAESASCIGTLGHESSGALAAVWYIENGAIAIAGRTGSQGVAGLTVSGSNALVQAKGTYAEYEAIIYHDTGSGAQTYGNLAEKERIRFNFNRDSEKYIRKVFNTNPQLTNKALTDNSSQTNYWLGQTFDHHLETRVGTLSTLGTGTYGVIWGLGSGSTGGEANASNHLGDQRNGDAAACQTGWYIAQDLTSDTSSFKPYNMQKLFKFHGLDDGEWIQNNLKVSISDLKVSRNSDVDPYGTFTVQVRRVYDTDNSPQIVEQYTNCSLNPASPNYIARKVGDSYVTWDEDDSRIVERGNYENNSKYFRVEMNTEVDRGSTNPLNLPFGVHGPLRFSGFVIISGSHTIPMSGTLPRADDFGPALAAGGYLYASHASIFTGHDPGEGTSFVLGGDQIALTASNSAFNGDPLSGNLTALASPNAQVNPGQFGSHLPEDGLFTGSYTWPKVALRQSASHGNLTSRKDAYFGVDLTQVGNNNLRFEDSNLDILRSLPKSINSFTPTTGSGVSWSGDHKSEHSWVFTLDDVGSGSTAAEASRAASDADYKVGKRAAGMSYTAIAGTYNDVLDQGFDSFTTVFHGGQDGMDITEKEPFADRNTSGGTALANSPWYTIKRAIDTISDPEVVECNLVAMPAIRETTLTDHLLNTCDARGDALAIVDIEGGYDPAYENNKSEANRMSATAVNDVVSNLKTRRINTSYGACYWPWVQVRDSSDGTSFWAPPSIAALGALSYSEANSELWFAPAGFNRGGLSSGAAGLTITGIRQRLTSAERDKLYEQNINPIAQFPAEGIVIFGQKTLQADATALDRINVRRLLIFVKKEISRMASTVLFDQNVAATWDRFKRQAEPFLKSVQARLGLVDFKVILDETTTTSDLIDRNIMYAKILLKPTRAIEFIALDFVITRSGASFED
tara:strand:+ start:14779 stop:17934 length:3156 start_codon:yes stop_codon:yes gene_type:complete